MGTASSPGVFTYELVCELDSSHTTPYVNAEHNMSTTRALTKQKTREALIDAGLALGAFYVHFPDRDAFLLAVMERVGGRFLDAVIGSGLRPTIERFVASVASGLYPLT